MNLFWLGLLIWMLSVGMWLDEQRNGKGRVSERSSFWIAVMLIGFSIMNLSK